MLRLIVAVTILMGVAADVRATSWYEAADVLAIDPSALTDDGLGQKNADGANMREKADAIVAEYDKIGAGEMVQQCLDASRIVQIAESRTGWKEVVFLVAAFVAFTVSLFITKIIASMFKIAVAQLLWIPIGVCVAGIVALFVALRRASKYKMAVAAGAALSALGIVTVVDPVRHAFFDTVAWVLMLFASIYVPFVLFVIGAAGVLLALMILFNNLCPSVGACIGWVLKNLVALAVIPFVSCIVFLVIMSVVTPSVDKLAGGEQSDGGASAVAGVPFASYPRNIRQTAVEMARVANDSYGGPLPDGAEPSTAFMTSPSIRNVDLRSWDASRAALETKSGLVAQVFKHKTGWLGSEMVVVFRGTASVKDLFEDGKQFSGLGEPRQYKEAAALVRAVLEAHDGPVVLIGHSLGAGQAQYALAMNVGSGKMRGVGFNAAGLAAELISDAELREGGSSVAAAGAFANIRLDNDPVSSAGTLLGNVVVVESGGSKGISSHSMLTLIAAMERAANQ